MKSLSLNIQVVVSFIVCLVSFGSLYAQVPSTPPVPPVPPVPMVQNGTHDTHVVKVVVKDDSYHGEGSKSTTRSSSNQNYRYTSIFEKDLTPEIEAAITKELGIPSNNSEYVKKWNHIDGIKINNFQVILRKGKVKIIYKNGTKKVMQQLNRITKAICKITYRSNCD